MTTELIVIGPTLQEEARASNTDRARHKIKPKQPTMMNDEIRRNLFSENTQPNLKNIEWNISASTPDDVTKGWN